MLYIGMGGRLYSGSGLVSPVTSATLLTVSTVILGLFLFGVFSGWFNVSLLDVTSEVDVGVQVIRSSISIEGVVFDEDNKTVYVRNVGKNDLIITRIELVDLYSGVILDSIPEREYADNLLLLRVGDSSNLTLPDCPLCGEDVAVKLRIWYIPEKLYDELNPVFSADEMSFVEHVVKIPQRITDIACPTFSDSDNWLFIEFVDPVAYVSTGRIAWDEIRILSPLASEYTTVEVVVTVTELNPPNRVRRGTGVIETMTNEISLVDANARGLYIPVEIEITPQPAWVLVPNVWIFGKGENNVHVSDITLTWDEVRQLINGAVIGVAKPRGASGLYEVRVYIKDCKGNIVSENSRAQRVFGGSSTFTVFVELPLTRLDQAYVIGTEVREVRP